MHLQLFLLDLGAVAAIGGAGDGDVLVDGGRKMQRQQPRDRLRAFRPRAAGIILAGIHRHHHRLVVDHHHRGPGLGCCRPTRRVDRGHRIGQVKALARLELVRVEILAHRRDHGIGVLRRDADIFQHPRQRVAGVQRHGTVLDAGIGIGIVGIVRRALALRLAGADQLHEQGIGQRRPAGGHHRMIHRHRSHRHPGDGARHKHGHGRGNERPATVCGTQRRGRAVQAPAQGVGRCGCVGVHAHARAVADFAVAHLALAGGSIVVGDRLAFRSPDRPPSRPSPKMPAAHPRPTTVAM